jgi:CubicO group peptidase (beta-lactamase class C family)
MQTATSKTSQQPGTGEIQGICTERFSKVREVLTNLLATEDIGASAAVFIDGEPVVDIYGGFLDKERTRPWQRDTIVNNFSTTKTMTALVALILADRGELDFDAPVAKYWPEFATNGKGDIEVRHLLGHTAALPGWTETISFEDMYDREKSTTLLAQQAPWWKPGTKAGYHPITYGPLIGEVVRRVTGKTLSAFFAEEVAGPLGADYHIGVGPELDDRVCNMIQGSPFITPTGNLTSDRAFFNPFVTPQRSGTIGWRRAELGGSNGHGNARSVALVQSVLACGGEVGGVRLLSRAGCERVFEMQADGADVIAGFDITWGMGYGIGMTILPTLYGARIQGRRVAFWGGSGGSWVINDPDARMTVAYVMNLHLERGGYDHRAVAIVNAAYDSLLGEA